jgi:hypothetical protein
MQIFSSQNFAQSSCPSEKCNPWRNLRLPNTLPREKTSSRRTNFFVIRFYLKSFVRGRLPAELILLKSVNGD